MAYIGKPVKTVTVEEPQEAPLFVPVPEKVRTAEPVPVKVGQ